MDKHFGWWVDMAKVTLSDTATGASSWVHALPLGTYQHPLHGELSFDVAKLTALATSVKQKTRGIDPDIDYDHKADPAKGNQAAGWVKDAEVRADGLHLHVDWTSDATKDIKDKKYRYFSAEFVDEWKDPQGVDHKDVLFGGGLTNRPFMKNLLPVNLSDLIDVLPPQDPPNKEAEVDLKKLALLLGLTEASTEEQVLTKLGEMASGVTKLTDDNKKLADELAALKTPPPTVDPQLKQLVDASPAFKKLMEDLEAQKKTLAEQQTALRLSEVKGQLDSLQQGKTFALAPSAREGLEKILLTSDSAAGKALHEFLAAVMEGKALVDLSEKGYSGRGQVSGIDPTMRFNDAVKALTEGPLKMDYGTAVEQVARENPQLFDEYRNASYQFKS
jgi:phage I-like protein